MRCCHSAGCCTSHALLPVPSRSPTASMIRRLAWCGNKPADILLRKSIAFQEFLRDFCHLFAGSLENRGAILNKEMFLLVTVSVGRGLYASAGRHIELIRETAIHVGQMINDSDRFIF